MAYRRRRSKKLSTKNIVKIVIISILLTFGIKLYKQGYFDSYITNEETKAILDTTVNTLDNTLENYHLEEGAAAILGIGFLDNIIHQVKNMLGMGGGSSYSNNDNAQSSSIANRAPLHISKSQNFSSAKTNLAKIYHKLSLKYKIKTLYCGCDIGFNNNKLTIKSLRACGYKVRHDSRRANRIEYEHVMPAHNFGHLRKCWVTGGRDKCSKSDSLFIAMEGDMHNLYPSVGEVNGDRSNFRHTFINSTAHNYGSCEMVIDSHNRRAMPPARARGMVARAYLYMENRYGIKINDREKAIYQKWDEAYKVDRLECERNMLIKQVQGNDNPFITRKCNAL